MNVQTILDFFYDFTLFFIQISINIQNNINLNNIEQAAKEMLGMQKLSSKQIVYINLSKEDYVLPTTETVIIEDTTTVFAKIMNFIRDVF